MLLWNYNHHREACSCLAFYLPFFLPYFFFHYDLLSLGKPFWISRFHQYHMPND